MFLEFKVQPPIPQVRTDDNTFFLDEYIPALDHRDENGWGYGGNTNKEKEDIANHQNQLPANVQRSMAEEVCSIDMEPARAKKGEKERGKT